jgi:hypothetical protein
VLGIFVTHSLFGHHFGELCYLVISQTSLGSDNFELFNALYAKIRALGSIVNKALCYKLEGFWFKT